MKELLLLTPIENNIYFLNNREYFLTLLNIVQSAPRNYILKLKKKAFKKSPILKYLNLLNWINNITPLLQDDLFMLCTKVAWILHGITNFPKCLNCNEPIKKNVTVWYLYLKFCSLRCQLTSELFKELRVKTWREKYNDKTIISPLQVKEILLKCQETCLKNNGVAFPMQSKEIFEKGRQTKFEKYGDKNFINNTKAEQTYFIKTGVHGGPLVNKELRANIDYIAAAKKGFETKKKNRTCKLSKQEQMCIKLLKLLFGDNDIFALYTSKDYPYHADAYIKSKNLYIEFNFHWTHGRHFFDSSNLEDLTTLANWKNKNTLYYNNAITTWTIRDLEKVNYAKKNKLNYLVFWSLNEFNIWLKTQSK